MKDKPRNMAASVRARLRNIATARGDDFQLVLTRYCLERLLYRLSCSEHGREFILKGAMLFPLWLGQYHRPTNDLDLLGRGEDSVERFEAIFRAVCSQPVEDDGLHFMPVAQATVAGEPFQNTWPVAGPWAVQGP